VRRPNRKIDYHHHRISCPTHLCFESIIYPKIAPEFIFFPLGTTFRNSKISQHQLSANPPTQYPEAKTTQIGMRIHSVCCKDEVGKFVASDQRYQLFCKLSFDSCMLSAYKFEVVENIYDHINHNLMTDRCILSGCPG
jgi:hypothetical protein